MYTMGGEGEAQCEGVRITFTHLGWTNGHADSDPDRKETVKSLSWKGCKGKASMIADIPPCEVSPWLKPSSVVGLCEGNTVWLNQDHT